MERKIPTQQSLLPLRNFLGGTIVSMFAIDAGISEDIMSDISEGSVVQLKSGGPKMTVRWIENGEAYCQWFSKDDEKGAKFSMSQLTSA